MSSGPLTHINDRGEAHMVDVTEKAATQRRARAEGFVSMRPSTLALIEAGGARKGDVLAAARIAGIMAAKRTHELIPLCHPLPITGAAVDFEPVRDPSGICVQAEVTVTGPTGVEMEAMTAAAVAALTLYDMAKGIERGMRVAAVELIEKTGGKSGTYRRGA